MAGITPEIVNSALDPGERAQYRNLLVLLNEGKVFSPSQQKKYDGYRAKCEQYLASQSAGPEDAPGSPPSSPDDPGLPASFRVKRRYTLSPEALAQRRAAASSPAKSEGMSGNRNNWQHGHYAKNFINKLKPCKSTCPQYPCALVNEGEVEPGEDCLDKADVISFYRAVHDAVANKKYDAFNELAALQIANSIKVVEMLVEDILRDGTMVKRLHYDKEGNLSREEYVPHPSLLALPKLFADLGLNPAEFLMTPRSMKRADVEEEEAKTFGAAFARAAAAMNKATSLTRRPTSGPSSDE